MEISNLACPKCGASIPEQVKRGKVFKCSHCSNTLVWPEKQPTAILSFGLNLCPDCGADNQLARAFCRSCGLSLTKICPICRETFYVGDNFCQNGHDYEEELQRQDALRPHWRAVALKMAPSRLTT